MKDLISIKKLSRAYMEGLFARASQMKHTPPGPILQGKVLANCFFEPSTRTRLSFESAMKRLGGEVIGFSESSSTSAQKGESLVDAVRVIGHYCDVVVMRHPLEGAARAAAQVCDKPVINAGDGANEHPTQTLTDLFSIHEAQQKIDGLRIALVGDLLHGRTVHSLAFALGHFDVRLYCISPPNLALPSHVSDALRQSGVPFSLHHTLDEVIHKCDILYMTRVQKERISGSIHTPFVLTKESLKKAKSGLKVLHPLPRVGEIAHCVDQTEHAYYFKQAENGLYVRQALLCSLLEQR